MNATNKIFQSLERHGAVFSNDWKSGKRGAAVFAAVAVAAGFFSAAPAFAEPLMAGAPQATTLSIYDQGFALVQELRRITVQSGENDVVIADLPRTLDPATTGFTVTTGVKPIELMEQSYSLSNRPSPELRWVLRSGGDGMATLRVQYRADGFAWSASHDLILDAAGTQAHFSSRVALKNESGRTTGAHVRLVLTERGLEPFAAASRERDAAAAGGQRFVYGTDETVDDRLVAGLSAVQTYELAGTITLTDGQTEYVTMASSDNVVVRRVFVYDGVEFDRFQRSRQTDWNYGTECHNGVDSYVEFDDVTANGLGEPLPPGRLRVFQQRDDVTDFLGEAALGTVAPNETAHARIGPARGLRGERERTGYTEITPMHEYEESFEIRLSNESSADATVHVVEHMYRGANFEIVKADTEYKKTGAQTIEFTPSVKAGGKRSIRYTVHYRW